MATLHTKTMVTLPVGKLIFGPKIDLNVLDNFWKFMKLVFEFWIRVNEAGSKFQLQMFLCHIPISATLALGGKSENCRKSFTERGLP